MRLRIFFKLLFLLFLCSFVFPTEQEFYKDSQFITPLIGINEFTIPFGVNYESAVSDNIGVGGTGMLWLWGEKHWSNTIISLSGEVAYHFTKIKAEKLDLFAGGGLGFSIYSWRWKSEKGNKIEGATGSSGLFLLPFIGARYYASKKVAFYFRLDFEFLGDWEGVGVSVGATIRLK